MSQNQQIYSYLQSGKTLTALQALDLFGCLRLASRVNEINSARPARRIRSTMIVANGKRIACYWIGKRAEK